MQQPMMVLLHLVMCKVKLGIHSVIEVMRLRNKSPWYGSLFGEYQCRQLNCMSGGHCPNTDVAVEMLCLKSSDSASIIFADENVVEPVKKMTFSTFQE